jgi:hypothetical protein
MIYETVHVTRMIENITVTNLNINHRPVFYLKHDVSETGTYLRLQLELIQLVLRDRDSFTLRTMVNVQN